MRRNYTWRLNGKQWQKVVRIRVNTINSSVSVSSGTYSVDVWWPRTFNGPVVP